MVYLRGLWSVRTMYICVSTGNFKGVNIYLVETIELSYTIQSIILMFLGGYAEHVLLY